MSDHDQSDVRAAQYSVAGIAVAFVGAGIGGWFANIGVAAACFIAAITIFIAFEKFQYLQRLRLQWPLCLADIAIHSPWTVFRSIIYSGIGIAVILSIILGETTYILDLRTQLQNSLAAQSGRHLTEDQKARMREALRLDTDERYYFDINSKPNCDECEDYAEEMREFISSIPGWKADGGTAVFWDAGGPQRGLEILTREDEKDSPIAKKLRDAFASASISLAPEYQEMPKGTVMIVVAKAAKPSA